MAKFRFELDAVLEQRRRAERDRQLIVAGIERERLELETAIRERQEGLTRERGEMREHLRSLGSGRKGAVAGVSMLMPVRQQAAAALRLQADAQKLVLRLAAVHKRLEVARRELASAMAARKAVEMLRQNRWDAWRREQDRREQTALDEIATIASAREAAGEGEPA